MIPFFLSIFNFFSLQVHGLRAVLVPCMSVDAVEELLVEVRAGLASRSVAATHRNADSSRSHLVLHIELVSSLAVAQASCELDGIAEADVTRVFNAVTVVDLAGSERPAKHHFHRPAGPAASMKSTKSGASSNGGSVALMGARSREQEGRWINGSLSVLGRTVRALAMGHPHPPYRDSLLTFLLRNTLSSNADVTLIANVRGGIDSFRDNLNTLSFATSAAMLRTQSIQNVTLPSYAELQNQIAHLKSLTRDLAANVTFVVYSYI